MDQQEGIWGLRDIARYVGWKSVKTPVRQLVATSFPIFKLIHKGRYMWRTDPSLVRMWMLSRVQIERENIIARKALGPASPSPARFSSGSNKKLHEEKGDQNGQNIR